MYSTKFFWKGPSRFSAKSERVCVTAGQRHHLSLTQSAQVVSFVLACSARRATASIENRTWKAARHFYDQQKGGCYGLQKGGPVVCLVHAAFHCDGGVESRFRPTDWTRTGHTQTSSGRRGIQLCLLKTSLTADSWFNISKRNK